MNTENKQVKTILMVAVMVVIIIALLATVVVMAVTNGNKKSEPTATVDTTIELDDGITSDEIILEGVETTAEVEAKAKETSDSDAAANLYESIVNLGKTSTDGTTHKGYDADKVYRLTLKYLDKFSDSEHSAFAWLYDDDFVVDNFDEIIDAFGVPFLTQAYMLDVYENHPYFDVDTEAATLMYKMFDWLMSIDIDKLDTNKQTMFVLMYYDELMADKMESSSWRAKHDHILNWLLT